MDEATKSRAKILILSHLAQFSLQRRIGNLPYSGLADMAFESGGFGDANVHPGDLVALQAAPPSKWYLSWLVSTQTPAGWIGPQYTLESIEDGTLCNWSNVSLVYYNREQVRDHPEWRWTDRQHQFNDRWLRVCRKERGAFIHLPVQAKFEDDAVILQVRLRYGIREDLPPRRFGNWRKTTKKMMLEYYDEMVALDESRSSLTSIA